MNIHQRLHEIELIETLTQKINTIEPTTILKEIEIANLINYRSYLIGIFKQKPSEINVENLLYSNIKRPTVVIKLPILNKSSIFSTIKQLFASIIIFAMST